MKNRILGLQALRGIAFLLIFCLHSAPKGLKPTYFGPYGVSIFIVMSGFLAMLWHRGGEKRGVVRRVWHRLRKIYPLHVITMLAMLPPSLIGVWGNGPAMIRLALKVIVNLLLVKSFIPITSVYFSLNTVAWYLSVVLMFALVEPILVSAVRRCVDAIARKTGVRAAGIIVCAILIAAEALCTLLLRGSGIARWLLYINPVFRLLDFAIGMAVGAIYLDEQKREAGDTDRRRRFLLALFSVAVSIAALAASPLAGPMNPWLFTLAWSPFSAMIVYSFSCASEFPRIIRSAFFQNRALVWIGNISMELFLSHYVIIGYCRAMRLFFGHPILLMILSLAISIAFAWIWHKVSERVSLKWRSSRSAGGLS